MLESDSNNNSCSICVIRPGLNKIEKSYFNLLFFILIHSIIETFVFFFILPCKIIHKFSY